MGFLKKVRTVLGKLTDLLNAGRKKGWWQRKSGPDEIFKDGLK